MGGRRACVPTKLSQGAVEARRWGRGGERAPAVSVTSRVTGFPRRCVGIVVIELHPHPAGARGAPHKC